MTTSTNAAGLVIAVVLAAAGNTGRAEVAMGESVDFPHAGIALAMPAGYQSQTVAEPFDIARAILSENGQPIQAVTVSAFPLDDPEPLGGGTWPTRWSPPTSRIWPSATSRCCRRGR